MVLVYKGLFQLGHQEPTKPFFIWNYNLPQDISGSLEPNAMWIMQCSVSSLVYWENMKWIKAKNIASLSPKSFSGYNESPKKINETVCYFLSKQIKPQFNRDNLLSGRSKTSGEQQKQQQVVFAHTQTHIYMYIGRGHRSLSISVCCICVPFNTLSCVLFWVLFSIFSYHIIFAMDRDLHFWKHKADARVSDTWQGSVILRYKLKTHCGDLDSSFFIWIR